MTGGIDYVRCKGEDNGGKSKRLSNDKHHRHEADGFPGILVLAAGLRSRSGVNRIECFHPK